MVRQRPVVNDTKIWTVLFAAAAVAFWIVGIGTGWRAWLLLDMEQPGLGIVAHAQTFGSDAFIWWIPASILTLTTVVLALVALVGSIAGALNQTALIDPGRPSLDSAVVVDEIDDGSSPTGE